MSYTCSWKTYYKNGKLYFTPKLCMTEALSLALSKEPKLRVSENWMLKTLLATKRED